MKRKVYETDSVSTRHEMKSFFAMIRELFPEIDARACLKNAFREMCLACNNL